MPETDSTRKRSRSPSVSDDKQNKRPNTGSGSNEKTTGSALVNLTFSMTDLTIKGSASPKAVGSADVPPKPPKEEPGAAQAAQIHMRCLIVTQDASIIIGKGGSHVNEIREKSGAKVMVSESIPGNPERILNVSGPLDAVSKVTFLVVLLVPLSDLLLKAFGLIVRRINDEPFDVPSVPGSRAVTIKFMIPNSRMGSVIGKQGSKIKEIQEASGARLNASEGMLPGSTEVRK
jgi:heterogeneous nuclear rnp K-like protein